MVSAMRKIGDCGLQISDNGFNTLLHEMSVRVPWNMLLCCSNVLALLPSRVLGQG